MNKNVENSLLNKEFKKSDVNRIKNLVSGKFSSSTEELIIGYEKEKINHKEGDTWEEDNITWTIKNGVKVSISKLENLRKELSMPFTCPECNKFMVDNEVNRKFYLIDKCCSLCAVKKHDKMKMEGIYSNYTSEFISKNRGAIKKEIVNNIDNVVNEIEQKEEYFDDNFEKEDIVGGSLKINKTDVEKLKTEIKNIKD